MPRQYKKTPLRVRIEKKITKEENGCWTWIGAMSHGKIPCLSVLENRKTISISIRRFLYNEATRKDGNNVHPICGNARCVNPAHTTDAPAPIRHSARLGEDAVKQIRERWARHMANYTSLTLLANEYGVTRQAIDYIVRGKIWQDADGPISGYKRAHQPQE